MPVSPGQDASHAFYSPRVLRIYDPMILGFFSRAAWRCPASRIRRHYNEHVTANHLDVGVGTGYFLDQCRFPSAQPRVALLDPNQHCLDAASARLARYVPEQIRASVLEPINVETAPFDSIGLNYVLHCLPGTIQEKAIAFEHLGALANPGAVVFGATLLHSGVPRNWYARQVMARNNRVGIFSNDHDDLAGLETALDRHLNRVTIEVVGCVAVFAGTVPQ